jgi:lipoprotein-anchoring transpeptidase ErfK/SrfK
MMKLSRRAFVAGVPLFLAGCVTAQQQVVDTGPYIDPQYRAMYGEITTEPFPVPAIDLSRVDPRFWRREVPYSTSQPVGTIVVDPNERYAYLVMEGGRAMRYGVGVGKQEGFNFQGEGIIGRKAIWPRWTPTGDMVRREPDRYGPVAGGLAGGPENPLGPRAMYLYKNGRDSYYRLHGTIEPWTIGTMVSSGCVRFMNQDIIDLYNRVPTGTRVIVLPARGTV